MMLLNSGDWQNFSIFTIFGVTCATTSPKTLRRQSVPSYPYCSVVSPGTASGFTISISFVTKELSSFHRPENGGLPVNLTVTESTPTQPLALPLIVADGPRTGRTATPEDAPAQAASSKLMML